MGTSRARLTLLVACLSLALPGIQSAHPADAEVVVEDFIDSAQQWLADNIDEDVLQAIGGAEGPRVREFLKKLHQELQGDYIIDLAALRDSAKAILPVLRGYEETEPYGPWLETRLDYLDVAEQLRLKLPARPDTAPQAPIRPPEPPLKVQREIWTKQTEAHPWPPLAKTYIERCKPVFASEKVPAELAWLAEVESSFDPRARSPVGAAGLYQLMPETAKRFGLRSWPLDQRLHPTDNARAAAKYLAVLHRQFKDWRLALAAYNCGEGTVQRLLQKHKARTFDEIAPYLPAETRLYVPKFEATLMRRENMKVSELQATPAKG